MHHSTSVQCYVETCRRDLGEQPVDTGPFSLSLLHGALQHRGESGLTVESPVFSVTCWLFYYCFDIHGVPGL